MNTELAQEYLDNWDKYWQSYLRLNPDLCNACINSKSKTRNHFIKNGIKENRQVTDEPIIEIQTNPIVNANLEPEQIASVQKSFVLQKSMFKD